MQILYRVKKAQNTKKPVCQYANYAKNQYGFIKNDCIFYKIKIFQKKCKKVLTNGKDFGIIIGRPEETGRKNEP